MKTHPLAKRYARALFELACQHGQIKTIAAELQDFTALLEQQPKLRAFFMSANIEKKRKVETLQSLLKGKLSPLFVNFLMLIIEKGRQSYFHEAAYAFRRFQDQQEGRIRAQLISAVPMTAEQVEQVRQRLADYLKAEIVLEHSIDAAILGGVIIRVEGKVIDGSLRIQIDRLRRELGGSKKSVTMQ